MLWSRVTIVFDNFVLLIVPKGSPGMVLSSVVRSPQTQSREQSYIKSQGIIKLIPTGSDPPTMCLSLCFQDSGV